MIHVRKKNRERIIEESEIKLYKSLGWTVLGEDLKPVVEETAQDKKIKQLQTENVRLKAEITKLKAEFVKFEAEKPAESAKTGKKKQEATK